MTETRQDQSAADPQMPDLRDVIHDLAHNRAQYINTYIDRRQRQRGPDSEVTDEQYDDWTVKAVQQWRELYPTLSALWAFHEAQQKAAKAGVR